MRLRRHETFRISTAKKEPKPKKTDHDKVKQNIVQIKHQIDELEKKFKSFLVLKKRQDANIGLKGMLEDPLSIEEMIQKAKANLSTFKTQKQNQNEDKTKSDQIIEDNLAKGTMETREWYRKRKLLIQAGPKFLRHTYSPFGNVILVSALTEFSFAVFSSRNTLELWEKVGQEFELKEAFEIPGTAILTALELYHQEMLKEVDYLADIPDAEDYLVGVRQANSSQDTTKNGSMANKLNESTSLLQQAPFRDRKLIQRTDLNRLAAQQVSNGGKSIDWDHYPFKTVPIVHHRHCYFLGYESGEAAIFEMITMYNPATKQMSYKAQVRLKKRISYTPVKLAFLYYLPDGIPIIATEISVKSGEGLVQGLQLNFEREWTCKCDMIRLTMMDKCTRYVNRDQPVDLDDNDLPRAPEEPIITAYAYDEVHMSILMGTSFGVLIRFFYQRDKKKGDDDGMRRPDSPASITSSLEPSLPGKLVYCLSTTPVAQEMVKEDSQGPPVSVIDSKGELLNAPLKITSVKEMTHPVKSVSSILVSSNDGTIRIYANDNLKISPKPQVFFADRFVRSEMSNPKGVKFPTILENIKIYCQVDYVCTLDGIHYIVDSLVIYDPMEASDIYLDVQILSFAIASGEIAAKITSTPKDVNYSIRILDNETGLIVIYHGKHWSLVSLQDTIAWRRNELNSTL